MMPLSELYHIDSTQQKNTNCSTDLSFIPDSDFVELVWENGQILMQGQSSSRARKTSNSDTLPYYDLPSHTFRSQVKDIGNDINSKIGRFGTTDSILNELGLSEDDEDDMVPWLNCHIDDSLQQDCYSDFLTGLSGVAENELSTSQTNFASLEKRSNFNQPIRDSHSFSVNYGVSVEQGSVPKVVDGVFYKPKTSQVYPLSSPQRQTSIPSYSSRVSDVTSNDTSIATHSAVCGDMSVIQASSSGYSHIEMQIQNPGLPNSSSGFMNFSHFSRPASMIKANLHNIDAVAGPSLPSVERIRCKDKRSVTSSGNPAEITLIDSNNGLSNDLRKGMSSNSQTIMAPTNVDTKPSMARPVNEPHPAEQSDALCHVDASKNDKTYSRAVGSNAYNGITDGENTIEAAVASSSVCSVSSVDRTSNDPTHDLKRKCHDTEVSDCPSDDVEEESVGAKKASSARGGSGSKRSRAAEVHNLSERRRRDRINEKMRALQELIPNSNKVDKASMLDEAIEYLKTLQLQLQIMSMGAGLYMQPMILPTGMQMQHMHAAHMAHFSPMGVGMGMGMGMVDVKGGSPGHPIMQVPPMQGVHFRGPPISGPSRLHAMAGSNLQMFGHAGQGHPMSMSHSPMIPLSAGPPMKSAIGVISSAGPVRNLNSAQACEKSGKI